VRNGTLIPTRPRVYALGYLRTENSALIWEAVLYAGPGAYLDGSSGAHHLELIRYPPPEVIVATPRRCTPLPGILVHDQRSPDRVLAPDGMPVATTPELMLSLAAEGKYTVVRFALANLEFRRELDVAALLAVCTAGRRGGALLRKALNNRLPQLAYCKSPLEVAFLLFCEAHHLPLPKVNTIVHGTEVDMYWRELGLVVELDGNGNHGTAFHKRRDATTMAKLRGSGLTVIRLGGDDVHVLQAATLTTLAGAGLHPLR
jgi:hypothetical protein